MYIKRVLLVKYETEYEISAKVGGANMQINILMNLKRIELDDDGGLVSLLLGRPPSRRRRQSNSKVEPQIIPQLFVGN